MRFQKERWNRRWNVRKYIAAPKQRSDFPTKKNYLTVINIAAHAMFITSAQIK